MAKKYFLLFAHMLIAIYRTKDPNYVRLLWSSFVTPRNTHGKFRFPFGVLQYIDIRSLQSQYEEIFLQRGYDFVCNQPAPTIIDCGGNIGLSVIRFKQCYPESRIITFEADPIIAKILATNVNSLNLTKVAVIGTAVSHQSGEVYFDCQGNDSGQVVDQTTGILVHSIRLVDWITTSIDLLKIDIEGSEYEVLLDLCETGKIHYIKRIICEFHGRISTEGYIGQVLTALSDSGFKYTITHARTASDLPGEVAPTPFAIPSNKYLLHLYAWQSD